MNSLTVPLELRSTGRLHGLILTEGRASVDRKELFLRGASKWESTGILIRSGHHIDQGAVRAFPYRKDDQILINIDPSKEIRKAVESGSKYMSVEFHSLEESITEGSEIREIQSALIVGAAVVSSPSYSQTKAEIRQVRHLLKTEYLRYL